jgi:hypothetical protein
MYTEDSVLSGQRFHLLVEILGIETNGDNNRVAVRVPAGETVTVLTASRPDGKRLVDVQWGIKNS